ncbi:MAG: DNA-processing protein DprA [Desulfobulbus sp.]|nr:DNA-processing protein DprA [Desulfobulbus sp.]
MPRNTISPVTQIILSLSMLKGVGPVSLRKAAPFLNVADFSLDNVATRVPSVGRALAKNDNAWRIAQDEAGRQIEQAERHQARIISFLDADEYPRLLAATKKDPAILYLKGNLAPRPEQSIAIVGTREPTAHGITITTRIARFFSELRWSVVSGLALGCDAAAHQEALDAGAHTVAVLAHGLHMVAPSCNGGLAQRIIDAGGALVSEYAFGQPAQAGQYVQRDRIQAGMARAVVMIQSCLNGGSLHASRAGLLYGRWLIIPYPTQRDVEQNRSAVEANLILSNADDEKVISVLKCESKDLERIIILNGRDDYSRMIEMVEA